MSSASLSTTLTADFAGFQRVEKMLSEITDPAFIRDLHTALAMEADFQVSECFIAQRDPYGKPWAKTRRGGQILRDTGRLFNTRSMETTGEGFRITFPLIYARAHNFGATITAKNKPWLRFRVGGPKGRGKGKGSHWVQVKSVVLPQRQFVPDKEHGLGDIFTAAFAEVIEERFQALQAVMSGGMP